MACLCMAGVLPSNGQKGLQELSTGLGLREQQHASSRVQAVVVSSSSSEWLLCGTSTYVWPRTGNTPHGHWTAWQRPASGGREGLPSQGSEVWTLLTSQGSEVWTLLESKASLPPP